MHNNNNRRRYRHHDNYRNHESENFDAVADKKYSKSLILIKSSVFALFIVFVTLLAAFFIIKSKKSDGGMTKNIADCNKVKTIKIPAAIDKVESENGVLTIVTKVSDGKQEILRLDSKCGVELSRIVVSQ